MILCDFRHLENSFADGRWSLQHQSYVLGHKAGHRTKKRASWQGSSQRKSFLKVPIERRNWQHPSEVKALVGPADAARERLQVAQLKRQSTNDLRSLIGPMTIGADMGEGLQQQARHVMSKPSTSKSNETQVVR